MKTSLFTRLQIILVVLFALAALTGPWLIQNTDVLVLLVLILGLAIGGVTFWIGWLAAVKKHTIEYPFQAWSIAVMKPFINPRQLRALQKQRHPITGRAAWMVGIASMVLGGVLVIAMISAVVYLNL